MTGPKIGTYLALIKCKGGAVSDRIPILSVDDDPKFRAAISDTLSDQYRLVTASDGPSALMAVAQYRPELILLDMNMPELSGLDFLRILKQRLSSLPIIMLTGETDPSMIVQAVKAGASDYVIKGTEDFETNLRFRISQVLRLEGIKKENHVLANKIREEATAKYEILGNSPSILKLKAEISKFKGTGVFVLINGENGTGKELVARSLHLQEGNPRRPFVAVNCGAITSTLFESELFGHVKGSFTGAIGNKDGYFVAANGGDIFLDEIGELPLDMQVKLLRVLQEKVVTPVGANKQIRIDVRVIAATNRDLEELVRQGKFRQDLYFRLNQVILTTPPLRERKDDILMLAQNFAERHIPGIRISPDARQRLQNHHWPGNIRELSNTIERSCILARGEPRPKIISEHLAFANIETNSDSIRIPPELQPTSIERLTAENLRKLVSWVERKYIEKGLKLLSGNNSELVERLGYSRAGFYRKKKELGLSEDREVTAT